MKNRTWRVYGAAATAMVYLLGGGVWNLEAAEYQWNNPLGGSFQTASNWLADDMPTSVPPGSTDYAVFNLNSSAAYDVTLASSASTLGLWVQTDRVNLNLGGFTYDTLEDPLSSIVGRENGNVAQLLITHGKLTANHFQVGLWEGSSGQLTLQGSDARIEVVNGFEVGNEGTGVATLDDYATVTTNWVKLAMWSNSSGTINVQNNASLLAGDMLLVGERNHGTLNISSGGVVEAVWILVAANSDGGSNVNLHGEINVDGLGSTLNVYHQVILGAQGLATMNISNQAMVFTGGYGGMVIGEQAGGDGQLLIQNAGVLTSYEDSRIAVDPLSKGRATVTGLGSKWDLSACTLIIGEGGDGGSVAGDAGLTIADGAEGYAGQLHLGGISVTQTPNDPPVEPPPAWVLNQSHGAIEITGINASNDQPSRFQTYATTLVGLGGYGYVFVNQGGCFETAELRAGLTIPWNDELGVEHLAMGTGTIVVEDPGSTLRVTANSFALGLDSHAQVTIRNGGNMTSVDHVVGWYDEFGNPVDPGTPGAIVATSSAWLILGGDASGSATVTVTGSGSTLNVDHAPMIVGDWGSAILNLLDQGQLNMGDGEFWVAVQPGSSGLVNISGGQLAESSPYSSVIGVAGSGQMNIYNEGSARFSSLRIGDQTTGIGQVTVDGSVPVVMNSLSLNKGDLRTSAQSFGFYMLDVQGELMVGAAGEGHLTIQNAAQARCLNLIIGHSDGINQGTGYVQVTGDSSTLDITQEHIIVGLEGHGTLDVLDGGIVNAPTGNLFIAMFAGSTGIVTVDGPGSQIRATVDDYGSWVGRAGQGWLHISNNGYVLVSRMTVSEQPEGQGIVNISTDGQLEVMHDIQLGLQSYGEICLDGGIVTMGDSSLFVNSHGMLKGGGNIFGSVDVQAGGTVSPGLTGNEFGMLTVHGNQLLAGESTLTITLGPASAASLLQVIGELNLDEAAGTGAKLNLVNAGGAWDGSEYLIITAGTLTQQFASENVTGLHSYYYLDYDTAGEVWLRSLASTILGDMNGDYVVNNQDISPFVLALTDPDAWALAYPRLDLLTVGDINGDAIFNNQDIAPFVTLLVGSGGTSLGESGAMNSVPEPATLLLLAVGGGLLALPRNRSRVVRGIIPEQVQAPSGHVSTCCCDCS